MRYNVGKLTYFTEAKAKAACEKLKTCTGI